MTAHEAAEMSSAYQKYNDEMSCIEIACRKGLREHKAYFTKDRDDARQLFLKQGFHLKDIIDEGGDYKDTLISW